MLKVKHVLLHFYWAVGTRRWWRCGGMGLSCSSDAPSVLNPLASTRHGGTWQLPRLPLPSLPLNKFPTQGLPAQWKCTSCIEIRETGIETRPELIFLQASCEVKVIFSPAEPKASHCPCGTSNSSRGSVATDAYQTALTQSSATLLLDSTDICI